MKLFLSSGEIIDADPELTLLENLRKAGIHIVAPCGGEGVCGRCKVLVKEGRCRSRLKGILSEKERSAGYVIACHSYPESDLTLEIPQTSLLSVDGVISAQRGVDLERIFASYGVAISPLARKIYLELPVPTLEDNISDMERLKRGLAQRGYQDPIFAFRLLRDLAENLRQEEWKVTVTLMETDHGVEILRISPGKVDEVSGDCGLAVDLGTTTVVAYLVCLETGRLVDTASTYNHQITYGEDVISRIVYAAEQGGLAELKEAVVADVNGLVEPLMQQHHLADTAVKSVVIAGNTTMTQLFLGLNPAAIRKAPYVPTANYFPISGAGRIGLHVPPDTPLYTVPCTASYLGGDIVAGVLAAKMHLSEATSVFMDLGTNGEMVVGNAEWMVAAACSAGPCFEGGGLKYGMRATTGAIDSVRINRQTLEPEITVLGGGDPQGICGSGIIDAVSEMFLTGIITPKGDFRTDAGFKNTVLRHGEPEFVLWQDRENCVSITETDINNVLRAKSAIFAGLRLLITEVGLTMDDVARFYIAGGFGRYLNIEKGITIGLFPDRPEEQFAYLGNTSAAGAYLCLLSQELREQAEAIAGRLTTIELSVSARFMDEYVAGLFLPHTNMSLFPRVSKCL